MFYALGHLVWGTDHKLLGVSLIPQVLVHDFKWTKTILAKPPVDKDHGFTVLELAKRTDILWRRRVQV